MNSYDAIFFFYYSVNIILDVRENSSALQLNQWDLEHWVGQRFSASYKTDAAVHTQSSQNWAVHHQTLFQLTCQQWSHVLRRLWYFPDVRGEGKSRS